MIRFLRQLQDIVIISCHMKYNILQLYMIFVLVRLLVSHSCFYVTFLLLGRKINISHSFVSRFQKYSRFEQFGGRWSVEWSHFLGVTPRGRTMIEKHAKKAGILYFG